jgi:hypothetical protein
MVAVQKCTALDVFCSLFNGNHWSVDCLIDVWTRAGVRKIAHISQLHASVSRTLHTVTPLLCPVHCELRQ